MLEGEDGTDYTDIVPAAAGAGRENLVRIGAAAPLAIQAHFLRLQPLWRAALGSRTAGRFLFPVLTPTSSATIPVRRDWRTLYRIGVPLC